MVALLRLCYDKAMVPAGGSEVVRSNASPVDGTMKEPAGRAHVNVAKRKLGILGPHYDDPEDYDFDDDYEDDDYYDDEDGEEGEGGANKEASAEEAEEELRWKETEAPEAFAKNLAKMKKEAEKKGREAEFDEWVDYYALVGCAHLRHKATTEDVQKGYKIACLKFHPDKTMKECLDDEEAREKAEKKFKDVTRGHEVLINLKLRREFDSIDHFDDTVPPADTPEAKFYETFGPLFDLNARFSEKQPVPELGDAETDMQKVDAFYKFWFGFKSWREFRAEGERTVSDNDQREHRREVQRENAKMRQELKKAEVKRLRVFVENAYECDPRIQGRTKSKANAKNKIKEEKERIRREKEEAEAAAKKAEEDKAAAEAASKKVASASAKKDKEKRRKEQQKNRKKLREFCGAVGSFDVEGSESLTSGLEAEKLKELVDGLEAAEEAAREEMLCAALKELDLEAATRMEARKQREATAQEEQAAARVAEARASSARLADWSEAELKALKKGLVTFPAGARHRWESIANVVQTRTAEEVTALVKQCPGLLVGKVEDAFSKFLADRKAPKGVAAEGGGAGAEKTKPAAVAWSEASTQALVKAMRAFPAKDYSVATERWTRIAAAVPGTNTPQQCQRKAAELAKAIKAKKAAAGTS